MPAFVNPFPVGSLVDVRPAETRPWRAGTVTAYSDNRSWTVALVAPITQEAWLGVPNRYAPAATLNEVKVFCPVNVVLPDEIIRPRA